MSVLLAAGLAAAAVAVLVGLPGPGRLRFTALDDRRLRRTTLRRVPAPIALVVAVPAALMLGPVATVLAVVAAVLGLRWGRLRRCARRDEQERASLLEALGALAGELRAGRPPAEALDAAAAVAVGAGRDALRAGSAAARLGADVPAALTSGGAAAVRAPLRSLAACWGVCAQAGSGLAAAVDRLEEGLRAEQAQRRAVEAELAGPRATAGLLAVLPAGGLLMAAGLGADPLHLLLHTPLGVTCLALGLLLDGLGVLWTGRLVRRAGASR